MAVRYTLVETNTQDVPTNTAVVANRGFNIPGGSVDEIIVRVTQTLNAAGDIAADWPNCISSARFILNGETCFDWVAGYQDAAGNGASPFGYFLNSMGRGRSVEVNPSNLAAATSREAYLRIPIGRVLPAGISRMEYTINYGALAGASSNNQIQFWIRYNSSIQTTTTIGAATTAQYSATTQQLVMRVPQNVPGTLAGVLVQNDAITDTDFTGFRIVSQSDFELNQMQWRMLNGDLYNGIEYMDPATGGELTFAQLCGGVIFLPLYGLDLKDDLRMQATCTTAGTLTLTPVITSGVAGRPAPTQVQTQAVPTNVAKAVLDDSAAQV